MVANFLAPFSVIVLVIIFSQNLHFTPHYVIGIDSYGLHTTLASSEPISIGFRAIYSQTRLNGSKSTVIKNFLLLFLLMGGDIQLNPGQIGSIPVGYAANQLKEIRKAFSEIIVIYGITPNVVLLETKRIIFLLVRPVPGCVCIVNCPTFQNHFLKHHLTYSILFHPWNYYHGNLHDHHSTQLILRRLLTIIMIMISPEKGNVQTRTS